MCDQADLAAGVRKGLTDRLEHLKGMLEEDDDDDEEEEEEEEEEETFSAPAPAPSRKRTAENLENTSPDPSGTSQPAAVVTGAKAPAPTNPFTKKAFSPSKRSAPRATIDNILSPSPAKLARSSTFSESARGSKRAKKRII